MRKSLKTLFLGQKSAIMGPKWPKKIFQKKRTLSLFSNYYFLPSCKKSENFNEQILTKSQKTQFLAQKSAIMGQYGPKNFSDKNELHHHLTTNIFYLRAKNQKILMTKFRENCKKPYFWAKNPPLWANTGQTNFL